MASSNEFRDALLRQLGRRALERAKAASKSKTLARALKLEIVDGEARITVPHYWAVYYHDGRGPITARPGHYLVYFKNPDDDPRIAGGYPKERTDIRRLSRNEFYRFLRERKIVVTTRVGPAPGDPFLRSPGVRNLKIEAGALAGTAFAKFVRDDLGDLMRARIQIL